MATALPDLYLGDTASHNTFFSLYSPQQSSRVESSTLLSIRRGVSSAAGTGIGKSLRAYLVLLPCIEGLNNELYIAEALHVQCVGCIIYS